MTGVQTCALPILKSSLLSPTSVRSLFSAKNEVVCMAGISLNTLLRAAPAAPKDELM